jgi:hypothetical protein
VMLLYAVCCALGVVGILIMHASFIQAYLVGAAVFLVGLTSLVALERARLVGG